MAGEVAGALFNPVPGEGRSPLFMLNANTGTAFFLGAYNETSETFTAVAGVQYIGIGGAGCNVRRWRALGGDRVAAERGGAARGWTSAVGGMGLAGPECDVARAEPDVRRRSELVSFPVAEYASLHNATFVDGVDLGAI